MVAIGFALVPASIVSQVVSERARSLKHMQVLSGLGLFAYWTANMIFDVVKALVPSAIAIGLLYAFDFFVSLFEMALCMMDGDILVPGDLACLPPLPSRDSSIYIRDEFPL